MTIGNSHPDQRSTYFRAAPVRPQAPAARRRGPSPATWFLLGWSLLVWPAVFASVVVATLLAAVLYLNADPGGPLGWPLAWVGSGILYSLFVGLPLSLTACRRRWYIRVVPAVIAVVPVVWTTALIGVWAVPGAATVALSILFESTGWRHKWMMRAWHGLASLWRRS